MTGPCVECHKPNGINILTAQIQISVNKRLIVKDNETRAWQVWKATCYTILVIALLVTVVHVVMCKNQDLTLRTVADIVGLQWEPISSAPSGIISIRTAICTDSNQPSAQNHEEVASIFTDTV